MPRKNSAKQKATKKPVSSATARAASPLAKHFEVLMASRLRPPRARPQQRAST